jgi:N-acetyltransferase B complex (NatB) non catalytic subunit
LRHPKLRNAQLALLDLASWRTQGGALTVEDLELACEAYYDRNRDKLYCFPDLRKHVVLLGDAMSKFLGHALSYVEDPNNGVDVWACFLIIILGR